jgi:hypothetical protein
MQIQDNFLTDQELTDFGELIKYNRYMVKPYNDLDIASKKIIDYAKQYYDFSEMHSCEMWVNYNQVTPVMHTDHDMKYFMETQIERYPICTIVYYPETNCSADGWLEVQGQIVRPVTNRIVCFGPVIPHIVRPFTGTRISVVYNPWTYSIV